MVALLTTTTTTSTHYLIVEGAVLLTTAYYLLSTHLIVEGRVLIFEDRLGLSRLARSPVTVLSRSVGAVAGHLGSGVGSRVRVRASGQWEGSG